MHNSTQGFFEMFLIPCVLVLQSQRSCNMYFRNKMAFVIGSCCCCCFIEVPFAQESPLKMLPSTVYQITYFSFTIIYIYKLNNKYLEKLLQSLHKTIIEIQCVKELTEVIMVEMIVMILPRALRGGIFTRILTELLLLIHEVRNKD